ncbi:ECF transporter S component [Williamsoniiplasma luminosum]|uniref:ECF transporter S component n=1 Tax=Williamsoniiplasma luminosum TaxID=214888 RepID=A0A2S0NKK2_9MOLU|nr:ECF transporter S component [Williamsoniiplasma luminosum]AVP49532.1 MAG: hypothetical protein C5T88_03060 [Williamsoniiplasma luminosum]
MGEISNFLLKDTNMAYATAGFTLLSAFLFFLTSALYYNYRKSRQLPYNGLKFTTKNITYIAMMVAVSVSITVVISMTLPVTVFPPIRIAFSGIMIKITGMFFGPIVGFIVGIVTEGLCIIFIPSYIHIAYLFVAISFGFWAGIMSYTTKLKGKNKWWTFSLINLYTIIFTAVMWAITINSDQKDAVFFGINIPAKLVPSMFLIMMGATLIMVWIFSFVLIGLKKGKWLEIILPIVLLCVVTETLATILLASWGDSEIFGIPDYQGGYSSMVIVRLLQTPLKIAFNATVLSTVFYVMRPILKK